MGHYIDLTGLTFNKLTVIRSAGRNKNGEALWDCQCECGGRTITTGTRLRNGITKSCGCLQFKQRQEMGKANLGKGDNLSGQKFGRWTVISKIDSENKKVSRYLCKCDCGTLRVVIASSLKNGTSKSCGCLKVETAAKQSFKHGYSRHPLYHVLSDMIDRCYNKNSKEYFRYGARGIKICDEWLNNRESFIDWALANGYRKGLTIDRTDNNGNYEPSNCRFVTVRVNTNNRRNTIKTVLFGKEMACTDIARKYNLPQDIVRTRIKSGKTDGEIIKGGYLNG